MSKRRHVAVIAIGCTVSVAAMAIGVAALVQGRVGPSVAVAVVLLGLVQLVLLAIRQPTGRARTENVSQSDKDAAPGAATLPEPIENPYSTTYAAESAAPPASGQHEPEPPSTGVETLDRGRLDLYLEPVIDVDDKRTVYYRASVALMRDDGTQLGTYLLGLTAERGGFASALDLATFRRVCPVVRHLRERNRRPGVFCPLAPDSFAERAFLDELVQFLRANEDAAGAMVIEISQPALGALSPAGMEGLAYLAELGATFCLSEAEVEGPDLTTLGQLGFKFLDLDVAGLASRHSWEAFGDDGVVCRLGRRAEQAGLTVIAANLVRAEELEHVRSFVRLARGTLFSPPRVVRRDITESSAEAAAA